MASPKTVLIIDDDPDFVTAISALLAAAGYQVQAASNGADGVHLARTLAPDLVLLDVIMAASGEGLSTLKELREVPTLTCTPVVLISSLNPSDVPVYQGSANAAGRPADLVLSKPLDPARLLAEAERLTRR